MDTSRISEVKPQKHFKTPRSHFLFGLVPFFLVFGSSLSFQLLDVCQVLLHVRQDLLLLDDARDFLLLLSFYTFDAFPLDLDGRGFLFGRLLESTFLARRQATGPLVRRRLPH